MALRRVFTYLGAVFLMSYIIFNNSASAITPIIDVSGYSVVYGLREVAVTCDYSDNTSASAYYCTGNNNKRVLAVTPSIGTVNFKKGDLIDFYLTVSSGSDTFVSAGLGNVQTSSLYFQILNFEQVANTSIPRFYYDNVAYLSYGDTVSITYHITLSVVDDYSGSFAVQGSSRIPLLSWTGYSNVSSYIAFLSNFVVLRNNGGSSSDQQNEINATNDSVQQSETEGASSQSDAQTGTASLISTIGSAVSAITTASPTNCLLNGNMGNFDMGQIDLCANPVPTFVQIISSLILILITVPLCIVMFNRFIGLFRSFQG